MRRKLIKIIELVIETGVAFWLTIFFSEKIQYEGIQNLLPWQKLIFYFIVFATTILIERTISWTIKKEMNESAERMENLFGLVDPRVGKVVSIVFRILVVSLFTYAGFKRLV